MRVSIPVYAAAALAACVAANLSCTFRASAGSNLIARTITVAQSAPADVVGSDSAALQKAADMLRPGDTLVIGPGAYQMNNSLLVGSGVTVRGTPGKTILLKSAGVESALTEDGDYGESYLAVAEPEKFHPGMGVTVLDDTLNSGWDVSISSVESVNGRILHINPMTVRDYNFDQKHARVRNVYPILCAMNAENVTFDGLTVDGNKAQNAYLDGCRGGAIYMYDVRNITVKNCVARNYNGDGISFQISDNVHVLNSESYGQTGFGIHPGTGSARALVANCRMHNNGDIGLFLCWRVRHGVFRDNVIEDNGHYGISIGHKDTDNEFLNNTIARNGTSGVYFRKETYLNSGHRNTFRNNKVMDNGNAHAGYGFYIEPQAGDIVIAGNQISDTRSANATQRYAIYKVKGAGSVRLESNNIQGKIENGEQPAAAGGQ
ncbi:MAG TPA: right-handed parallel beta-helix repeat-containing protein [Bryobacteraceae bacterium]|nr:right-handed parallel beta-helix repeat-containing protein [Bryobacteraceae bacterium]